MTSKEKEIVCQFRALAADPDNRPYIVSQGCLPGLVLFLNHSEEEIVLIALETLDFISQYAPHRCRMAKEAGLAASLRKLMLHPNPKLKNLAIAVYSNIQDHFADREPMKEVIVNRQEKAETTDPLNSIFSDTVATKLSAARTYHIYVKGLTEDTRQNIESVLLQMKGVISFLLDIQAGKAVIRILVTVDSVVSALRAAGVIVTGVEEHGDPTKTYTRPAAQDNKENTANNSGRGWWGALVATADPGSWWGSGKTYNKKKSSNEGKESMFGKIGKVLWG